MKNIHGKFLLLFLLLVSVLNAKESHYCSYEISSSKKSAVVHEAVNISFTTRQKIHNEVMFFDLRPLPSDDYEIISIKEKRHEFNYHDAKKEFEFLVIPKREGIIKIAFDFRIRRASDDAVAQAYTGSRDNVKSIPTIKVHIDTPTVILDVKNLNRDVDAVGDFNLVMSIDKSSVNSYDTLNVVYTLQGRGYLDKSFEPIKSIEGVSIFRGKKVKAARATEDGYIYKKEWSYALVASKDYTVPIVTLKTYNYRNKQSLDRVTKKKNIRVTTLDMADLVDDEDLPNANIDYKTYIAYLYSILIFLAGFLFAKLLEYLPKKLSKKDHCCPTLISAKTPKELLSKTTPFLQKVSLDEEIQALEELVYKGRTKRSFKEIKLTIIEKIKG